MSGERHGTYSNSPDGWTMDTILNGICWEVSANKRTELRSVPIALWARLWDQASIQRADHEGGVGHLVTTLDHLNREMGIPRDTITTILDLMVKAKRIAYDAEDDRRGTLKVFLPAFAVWNHPRGTRAPQGSGPVPERSGTPPERVPDAGENPAGVLPQTDRQQKQKAQTTQTPVAAVEGLPGFSRADAARIGVVSEPDWNAVVALHGQYGSEELTAGIDAIGNSSTPVRSPVAFLRSVLTKRAAEQSAWRNSFLPPPAPPMRRPTIEEIIGGPL